MVKKLVWVFIVLLAAAGGAVIYVGQGPIAPGETQVATMGSVLRSLHGAGKVEGLSERVLVFPFAGRLDTVNVNEGQEVVLNDVLAELNPSDAKKQIAQAEAALKEAVAERDLAKNPPSADLIKQAEEKFEQAKAAVKLTEVKLKALESPPKPPAPEKWQVDDAQRSIDDAGTQLELAQIELKKLKDGPNPDDVAVAKAKLDAATTERDGAKRRLEQFKGGVPLPLFGKEPKETKADLEAALERAEEAVKVAQAEYDRVKRGPKQDDVRAAELKVEMKKSALEGAKANKERLVNPVAPPPAAAHEIEQANLALLQARAGERYAQAALAEVKRGPDPATVRAKDASVEKREAELAQAKLRLEALKLRATCDGVVTKRHVEAGATVQGFAPIITLVDFSQKRVRAEYDVTGMRDLKPGMPVIISSRAFNKETLDGKLQELGRVGPRKVPVEDPSASKGGEIQEVLIAVDEPKGELKKALYDKVLRPGLSVEAEVILERRDNVLRVPKSFVSQEEGQEYVWRLERDSKSGTNEAPRKRYVKCGLKDEHFVEIVDGLSDGDRIMKPKPANGR